MSNRRRNYARARNKYTNYRVHEPNTLMEFLMEKMPEASRTRIKSFLSRRMVYINKEIVTQFDYPLKRGTVVQINHNQNKPSEFTSRDITVLYEDAYLIVINKNTGVLSIATGRSKGKSAHAILNHYVKRSNHQNQVFLIHKLESEESGIMIFAKDEQTKFNLQERWRELIITHSFVGVLEGEVKKDEGVIVSWLDENTGDVRYADEVESSPRSALRAITRYKTIKRANGLSLVEFEPREDRNNKIRTQMAEIGHPVLGDRLHGEFKSPIRRLALHSFLLRFRHPVTGELMKYEIPYPQTFRNLLLRKGETEEE